MMLHFIDRVVFIAEDNFPLFLLSLPSYPVSHESTHGSPTFTVVYSALAWAHHQKDESNWDGRLQNRVHHNRVTQPNKGHRGFMQGVQYTYWKKHLLAISASEPHAKTWRHIV